MTPEAGDYLAKARTDLGEAGKIAALGLSTVAARSAYYAVFHAAEAFIIERTGKVAKTHSGVRSEFARLAKDDPAVDAMAGVSGKGVQVQGNRRLPGRAGGRGSSAALKPS